MFFFQFFELFKNLTLLLLLLLLFFQTSSYKLVLYASSSSSPSCTNCYFHPLYIYLLLKIRLPWGLCALCVIFFNIMGSMNLLGFSLSPQEHPSSQDHSQTAPSRFCFNPDGISSTDVAGDCFDLTSDSTPHLLNLPSYGIYEAFHRNNSINTTQGFHFFPHKFVTFFFFLEFPRVHPHH